MRDNHSILAFVDPFGLGVSHDSLVDILRQSRTGRPIDVLYHFSLSTVARMGSVGISPDADYAEQNAAHLDRVLGASVDWRGMFKATPSSDGAATRTAIAVAHAFGASLQTTTGMRCTSIEVRQRPDQLPKYLLMLISRDPSGRAHWDFADVAASAHAEWLLHCDVSDFDANIAVRDNFGLLSLWDPERPTLDEIKRNLDAIADRDFDEHLRRLFRQRSSFRLVDDVAEAFGPMLGRVGHPAVRRAIRRLHSSGLIDDDGKGDFHTRTITWIG